MIKVFFTTVLVMAILVFIYVIMQAKHIALHFKKHTKQTNTQRNDALKQLCPNCKTGSESYQLDKQSESCPYIGCLKDGKCNFYEPF